MMRSKVAISVACTLMIGLGLSLSARPARALSLSALLGNKPEPDNIKKIHTAELAALMHDRNAHLYIYDVNLQNVREQYGIIPGARLLSSPDKYDIATELPADKHAQLVFYCTNLH